MRFQTIQNGKILRTGMITLLESVNQMVRVWAHSHDGSDVKNCHGCGLPMAHPVHIKTVDQ